MPDIETMNDHLVCSSALQTGILMPPTGLMSSAEAFRLAAWLVVIAEANALPGEPTFAETLDAIRST